MFTTQNHLVDHLNQTLVTDNTLHCLLVYFNPMRFQSRARVFRMAKLALDLTPNIQTHVIEVAFGDRAFEVTEENNPDHLQLRTDRYLWFKENALDILFSNVIGRYPQAQYFSWIDGDVFWPLGSGWANETLHQLQAFDVVQPWRDCLDLDFTGAILPNGHHKSFAYCVFEGIPMKMGKNQSSAYTFGHPGYAWACTRAFVEHMKTFAQTPGGGPLMSFPILGAADHHQAWAMLNKVEYTFPKNISAGYKEACYRWQRAAYEVTGGVLGFVGTRIEHLFGGSKGNRAYVSRWNILTSNNYDPFTDLGVDAQGLMFVKKPSLENAIYRYFQQRAEDNLTG